MLSDSEEADLLVDFTLEPKKALKRTIKDAKKDGYVLTVIIQTLDIGRDQKNREACPSYLSLQYPYN